MADESSLTYLVQAWAGTAVCRETAAGALIRVKMFIEHIVLVQAETYDGKQARLPCTYSECVSVASVIQHTKRMRRFILPSVACLALPLFSTLSHKRHDSRGGGRRRKGRGRAYSTRNVCFDFLYNF